MFEKVAGGDEPKRRLGWGWLRWLVRILVGIALVPVLAVVGLYGFLWFYLPSLLNAQPERLQVTWDAAWPSWPGDVEVLNLAIRSQGPVDQWYLQVDHVTARVDVDLLRDRIFSVQDVKGSGVSFLYRVRRGTPEVVSPYLPPIPGLTNPPDPSPEDIYPPPAEPWRILLNDVTATNVREVWIEDYHYVGRASASGRLDLTPNRWVQVEDARLDLEEGQLLTGDVTTAAHVKGAVTFALDGSDPTTHVGDSLFGVLTFRAVGDAQVRSLAFLDTYLRKAPWLRFQAGAGTLDVDLGVERGVIRPGSHIGATLDDIDARLFSYRVRGDGRVRVDVGDEPGGVMVAEFRDYTIVHDGDAAPHVQGTGFKVTARAAKADLGGVATDDLKIVVDLPESTIPDARVYNAYLPKDMGLALVKGRGTVRGRLTVTTADNKGVGELVVKGSKVQVRLDDLLMTGDVSLQAKVPASRIDQGRYDVSGTRLELRNVRIDGPTVQQSERGTRGWWAVVWAPQGLVKVGATEYLDARMRLSMRDSQPFVTAFATRSSLPKWMLNLLAVEDIKGEARLRLGEDSFTLPQMTISGGQFDVELQLARRRDDIRGKMYARWGILGLGIYRHDKKNTIQLVNPRKWYDAQPGVQ